MGAPSFRNTGTKLVLVAALALGLRLVYIHQASESPLFDAPMVDAGTYVENALQLADGAWEGNSEPFWQPPLYPYFLAVLFALFGEGYYLPRFVQAAAGAVTCVLLFFLGRSAFSPSTGWLAAGMAVLYGPFLYFEGELLPVGLSLCLNVLLLLVLLWAAQGGSPGRWLLAGLVLGVSGLTVANAFLFAPVVLFWAVLFQPAASSPENQLEVGRLDRLRLFQLAAFLLGLALVVAPVTLRNRIVGGDWVLVSHNAGINFYIGNNPRYDETVEIRPGRAWIELVNEPGREAGITRKSAESRYFFARSWEFISADPAGYLELMLRKVYLFWRGDEIGRNLDPYYARKHSSVLQILLWKYGLAFPFGVVSALALLGLGYFLSSPRRWTPAGWLVLLSTSTYVLSVVLFFISGRYRLPAVPFLLLFAAHALVVLRQQRGKRLALSAALLAVLSIGTNVGVEAMDTEGDGNQHYWMGTAYANKGMKANALREFRHAAERDPSHEGALTHLASMYGAQKKYDEAIEICRQLLHYYPDRADVRLNLADMFVREADFKSAIDLYQDLVPQRPDWAALRGRLAYAYLMAGARDEAEAAYRKTLELNPDSLEVRYQLARVYEVHGREDQAVQEYTRLLEQQPGQVDVLCRLADLLAGLGKEEAAETCLEEALAADARSVHALRSMARLETRRGDCEAALRHLLAIAALDTDDYLVHRELGQAYLKAGDKKRAAAAFERYERGSRRHR